VTDRRIAGFTLFEVLIAMVILAVGALGLMALQLHGMRASRQNAYHSSALIMAAELAEIMRANPPVAGQANSYLFDFRATANAVTSAQQCYTEACSPRQFAAFSISEWQARLQDALPGARAVVCRDSTAQQVLQWSCSPQPDSRTIAIKIGWRPDNIDNALLPRVVLHVMPGHS